MTRLRRVIWLFAFLLTLLLAFVLRNTIRDVIILPLTYAWWETTLLYFAIPELVKWSILLVLLGVLVVLQLIPEYKPENRGRDFRVPSQGHIESLAVWIRRARDSNYFKWQLANRLGRLALRIREQMGSRLDVRVDSGAHNKYLAAGIENSFVDFPGPRHRFQRRKPTPLDLDPAEVVAHLENQMEANNGGNA